MLIHDGATTPFWIPLIALLTWRLKEEHLKGPRWSLKSSLQSQRKFFFCLFVFRSKFAPVCSPWKVLDGLWHSGKTCTIFYIFMKWPDKKSLTALTDHFWGKAKAIVSALVVLLFAPRWELHGRGMGWLEAAMQLRWHSAEGQCMRPVLASPFCPGAWYWCCFCCCAPPSRDSPSLAPGCSPPSAPAAARTSGPRRMEPRLWGDGSAAARRTCWSLPKPVCCPTGPSICEFLKVW